MSSLKHHRPISSVAVKLERTPFSTKLSNPWVCELRSSTSSRECFCDLIVLVEESLEISAEVYSFGSTSPLAEALIVAKKKRMNAGFLSKVTNKNLATIICLDNLCVWDPCSTVAPLLRNTSVVDRVLLRLPSLQNDVSISINWNLIRPTKASNTPPLRTVISTFESLQGFRLLGDMFCCSKTAEERIILQKNLLQIMFTLDVTVPNMSQLMKGSNSSGEPFRSIAAEVFGPLCKANQLEHLATVELALAVAEALESAKDDGERDEKSGPLSGVGSRTNVDHLLRKYENALMLAHLEDAESNGLESCRPILLNAIKETGQLTHIDDVFLVLIKLVNLLPSRGCNTKSRQNQPIIEAIDNVVQTGLSMCDGTEVRYGSKGGIFSDLKLESPGNSILGMVYRRHSLPTYREMVKNQDFPILISPIVQLFTDFANARHDSSSASPALQALMHWPLPNSDKTFLSGMGKWIGMSAGGRQSPYSVDLVIVVVQGSITWTLAKEIVFAASKGSRNQLEVFIICESLQRGGVSIKKSLFSPVD